VSAAAQVRSAGVLVVLASIALTPGTAAAGSYEVKFCDGISASATPASPDGRGFVFSASTAAMANGPVQCPTNSDPARGMAQRNTLNRGLARFLDYAAAIFYAPGGATVRTLKWRGMMHRSDCHWTTGVVAGGSVIVGLRANEECGFGSFNRPTEFTWEINSGSFAFIAVCGNFAGCDTTYDSSAPTPGARALIRTYSARILVEDSSASGFANIGGGLASGGWVRGSQTVTADVTDNVGVASSRFLIDGTVRREQRLECDYALARPCPSPVATEYPLDTTTLSEGEHRVSVAATDTAGNASSIERTFLVDNTAPARPRAVSVTGGDGWRGTNSFDVSWTNPPDQMAPIVAAHYSLCPTAGSACVRGSRREEAITALSDLQLPGPGDYALRIWLEDAAGNADEQAASDQVHLRLDDRAPAPTFDPPDPGDPLRVVVSVSDEHSGLAGGEIELQRTGSNRWRVLATEVAGPQLIARIPDERLPDGEYALRARAADAAGNVALTDRRGDGSIATVVLPLRVVTSIRVGVRRVLRQRRSARGQIRRRKLLVPRVRLGLGARRVIHGRLTNRDGQPTPGQRVEVFGRTRMTGATWEPLGVLTTGPRGRFRYRVWAKQSRIIRFVYRGSLTVRPAVADAKLTVRARSSLHASRRWVLNGDKVRFRGRVRGRPLPPSGKLVQLQAHFRGRWRTFAAPRADASGRWRYTYRFGATAGRVVYRLRAAVPRQDLFPFARGRSRTVRVVVRGL
jgi:hypothetical protein